MKETGEAVSAVEAEYNQKYKRVIEKTRFKKIFKKILKLVKRRKKKLSEIRLRETNMTRQNLHDIIYQVIKSGFQKPN